MRKTTIILILALLTSCGEANRSESGNFGVATFSILSSNFNCSRFRKSLKNGQAIPLVVLWGSFGQDLKCLESIHSDYYVTNLQVHLVNEVCQRNDNCGPNEVFTGTPEQYKALVDSKERVLMGRLESRVKEISEFVTKNTPERCLISPGLESNLPPESMESLINHLQPLIPECSFVYNPNTNFKEYAGADFYEHHNIQHDTLEHCIANNDGRTIGVARGYPRNMSKNRAIRFAHESPCEVTFLWDHETSNCIDSTFNYPNLRDCENQDFERMLRLLF